MEGRPPVPPAPPTRLVRRLILGHFELIRAYQAAIHRAAGKCRAGLASLMADHEAQARSLVAELIRAGVRPPTAKDVSGEAAGRIAGLKAEREVFQALFALEESLASAYRQAEEAGVTGGFGGPAERHLAWLRERSRPPCC